MAFESMQRASARNDVRELIEARRKAASDVASQLLEAREQGLEQGREQGLEQSRQQGLEQSRQQGASDTRREIARAMLLQGASSEDIKKMTGIDSADLA